MGVDPASIGIKVALMAAQMALTATNKIEGPRLESLDVTTADYGTPLTYFWGKRRLEGCPIIWAEKLREKKVTSKTKGGKYSEYKYYGTFAIAIADHPIDAISRIWMDKHLVYDATKAGPISPIIGFVEALTSSSPVKLTRGKNMRVYLGSETQLPDPRMESWCEDRYGVDSCPAYRGLSYLVFEELPLEKFGNRIPQLTVEAVNDPDANRPWDTVGDQDAGGFNFAPDYSRFHINGTFYDAATLEPIYSGVSGQLGSDGNVWTYTDGLGAGGGPYVKRYFDDGRFSDNDIIAPHPIDSIKVVRQSTGDAVCFFPYASIETVVQYVNGPEIIALEIPFVPSDYVNDSDDNLWAIGDAGTSLKGYCFSGPLAGTTRSFTTSASTAAVKAWYNSDGNIVLCQSDYVWILDNNWAELDSATGLSGVHAAAVPGGYTFWRIGTTQAYEYNSLTLSLVRTITLADWKNENGGSAGSYDPISHALITFPNAVTGTTWRYLDRVGASQSLLSDVIEDVAGWCGASVDVTDLDQVVAGYSVTQGSGKDMIAPLLDVHDVTVRPHDFTVQFQKRGKASLGTILTSEFVREGDEPRYSVVIKQDTDIPRKLTLNFADSGKDQQANTVISQRPLDSVDGQRTQQIDMTTYVATPAEAQQFSDRYFRRLWNEREEISLALSAQRLAIEPGDAYNLSLDGVERYARCVETTFAGGRINTRWVRDALSFNALSSGEGADMEGRDEDELFISTPTRGIVLDLPLLQDVHNDTNPLFYYGAGSYSTSNWPGATIFERDAEGDYVEWNSVAAADKAAWGYATEAWDAADYHVWDNATSVNVNVKGELTSRTEAEIDANPTINMAVLGDEVFNFKTATLQGDGSYTLSGFKRGRRGTEWAIGDHAEGDLFVLAEDLTHDARGLSDIGTEYTFKAQSGGRALEGASAFTETLDAASLKPYAPAHFKGVRNTVTNDWVFTWTRRTRVGGRWTGLTTIPLGETTESYKVRIYNGSTLERTLTVSSETATWTSAQQVTDLGSNQTSVTATVCQVADAVEGYLSSYETAPAPSIASIGTFAVVGTGGIEGASLEVPLPTGVLENDILLMAIATESGTTVTIPGGWSATPSSPQSATDQKLLLCWQRAGASPTAPTITKPFAFDQMCGQIFAVRNALAVGSPFDTSTGGSATTTSKTLSGFTTNVDNCLVIDFLATGNDIGAGAILSAWANASLTGFAERADTEDATTNGTGLGAASGVKATAGVVGNTTVTSADAETVGYIKLALRPV